MGFIGHSLFVVILFVANCLSTSEGQCSQRQDASNIRCSDEADYMGCYIATYLEELKTMSLDDMTMTKCFGICKDIGYRYAGLYNGSECQCACSPPGDDGQQDGEDMCGVPCPGDVSTFCGGRNAVQTYAVFIDTTTAQPEIMPILTNFSINGTRRIEECSDILMQLDIKMASSSPNYSLADWPTWDIVIWGSLGKTKDGARYLETHYNLPSLDNTIHPNGSGVFDGSIHIPWNISLDAGPSCQDLKFICVFLQENISSTASVCEFASQPLCQNITCEENLELRLEYDGSQASCVQRAVVYSSNDLTNEEKLGEIEKVNITTETVEEVLTEVISITNKEVESQGVALTTNVLESVVSLKSNDTQVTTDVITILDNLMETDSKTLAVAQEKNGTSSRALKVLEKQLEYVDLTQGNGSFKAVQPNLGVQVQSTLADDLEHGLTFVSNDSDSNGKLNYDDIYITSNETQSSDVQSAITVQAFALTVNANASANATEGEQMRVAFAVVQQPSLFTPDINKEYNDTGTCNSSTDRVLPNTAVLSVTVQGSGGVQTNVTSVFHPLQKSDNTTRIDDPVCVFWDFDADDGRGAWSDFGCAVLDSSDDSAIRCECNHTTNFAVIMNFHDIKVSKSFHRASKLLSIIGCSLSIASLLLTLAIYLLSPKLRKKQPNQIFMNICVSLIFLYIVYLVLVTFDKEKPDPCDDDDVIADHWCRVLAASVQYFTLTTLAWMGVEGFNMYLLFVRVVNSHIPAFIFKASVVAWGIPALIVIITGAVARTNYTSPDLCFLATIPKIAGLLVPIAIIIILNFIIYTVVLVRLSRTLSAKMATKTHGAKEGMERFQKAVCIFLLLGLTWSFGYLLLIDHQSNQVFQIIFILFNSFQGFLIFVLYCLRQPTVRKELIKYCCCCCARQTRSLFSSIRLSTRGDTTNSTNDATGTMRSTKSATLKSTTDQFETSCSEATETLPRPKYRFSFFNKYF